MIVLTRADDRLIHGLVAVAWTSHLAPETILVANDAAAADEFKKSSLKLAKPAGVKLFVKSVEKAAAALNNPINDNKKIFLVTQTVEDAKRVFDLLDDAHKFTRLNVGTAGVNKKPGEEYVAIIPQVYTTAEELAAWQARSGLPVRRFFNTSGRLYRERNVKALLDAGMVDADAFALLAEDGMLVKRPIVAGDDFVLVGFREAEWEAALL